MDNMTYISLSLVGSKLGQTQHSTALFCKRKLSYSINVVYEIMRQNYYIHVFTSENTVLNKKKIGEGSHTVTIRKTDLPLTTKRFKGSHTDNALELFFRTQRGSNYELVVFLGCKPSANSPI